MIEEIQKRWASKYNPSLIQGYDCGDCANRSGAFYALAGYIEGATKWQMRWLVAADLLERNGILLRGKDLGTWPSDYYGRSTSRDQTAPFLAACIIMGDFQRIKRIKAQWKSRFYFGQNTYANYVHPPGHSPQTDGYPPATDQDRRIPDICTPALWTMFNYDSHLRSLVDIMLIGDNKFIDKHWDWSIQAIPQLIALNSVCQTWSSRKALLAVDKDKVKIQVKSYFIESPLRDTNGLTEMADLYIEALAKAQERNAI